VGSRLDIVGTSNQQQRSEHQQFQQPTLPLQAMIAKTDRTPGQAPSMGGLHNAKWTQATGSHSTALKAAAECKESRGWLQGASDAETP